MTAQVRLANNAIKASPGFSIFVPGDLHTINLEDFPPSATHAPLSLLPLLQDAGWTDEDSSSRPVAARASAGRPGPQYDKRQRLVVAEDAELPAVQHAAEVPDRQVHRQQFPIKSEILLLGVLQLLAEEGQGGPGPALRC